MYPWMLLSNFLSERFFWYEEWAEVKIWLPSPFIHHLPLILSTNNLGDESELGSYYLGRLPLKKIALIPFAF